MIVKLVKNQVLKTTFLVTVLAVSALVVYGMISNFNITYSANPVSGTTYKVSSWNKGSFRNEFKYCKSDGTSCSRKDVLGFFEFNGVSNGYAFCAGMGKTLLINSDSKGYRKQYKKYLLEDWYEGKSQDFIDKFSYLLALVKPNMSTSGLVTYLQTNYPTEYANYKFANLTKAEMNAAGVMAVWHFSNGYTWKIGDSKNESKESYIRVIQLYKILEQNDAKLKGFGNQSSPLKMKLDTDLTLSGSSYTAKLVLESGTTTITPTVTVKTNKGATVASSNYTTSFTGGNTLNLTFNNITTSDNKVYIDSKEFDSLYVTTSFANAITETVAYIFSNGHSSWQLLAGADTSSKTYSSQVNLTLEVKKVDIVIDKVDEDNLSSTSLVNSRLELYRIEGSTETLVDSWLTVSEKPSRTISDLAPGTYKIVETHTPDYYTRGVKEKSVSGTDIYIQPGDTFVVTGDTVKVTYHVHVYNKLTEIKIDKIDATSHEKIAGAKFIIVDENGDIQYEFTSTGGDTVSFKGVLQPGIYYLIETEAPTGYVPASVAYRFNIGYYDEVGAPNDSEGTSKVIFGEAEDNSNPYKNYEIVDAVVSSTNGVITVTLSNTKGLVFSKKELVGEDTYKCVDGAHLTLKDSTGAVVEEWTSDCKGDNGDHQVSKTLADGKYTLTETIPAPGYASAEAMEFDIKDNEIVNKKGIMLDKPLVIELYKYSTNSSQLLAGAEFALYDKNENKIATFVTQTTPIKITDYAKLKVGEKYTLVETKAPKGYKKAANYTFTVRDTDEVQRIEVEDEIIIESTGSNTPITLYLIVLALGIIGVTLITVYKKKYQYDYFDY